MFDDLIANIYSEVGANESVSLYRRNLQRTFIEGLERTLEMESNRYEHTDMKAVARGKLKSLKANWPSEISVFMKFDICQK